MDSFPCGIDVRSLATCRVLQEYNVAWMITVSGSEAWELGCWGKVQTHTGLSPSDPSSSVSVSLDLEGPEFKAVRKLKETMSFKDF